MILLPAIDLKDGRCVRLRKGEFDTAHQVAASALDTARAFREAGAKWVHMVDLDGARNGRRQNFPIIDAVIRQSGLKVEVGGGLRSAPDLITAVGAGAARAVIGSAAVTDPALVDYAVRWCPEQTAVGIDSLDGRVRTVGWEADSGLDYLDFARTVAEKGVKVIVFTDIATDGMLSGPSYDKLSALQKAVPECRIVASGGVTTLEDVKRLRDMGLYAAIIGKAYYAGTLDLAQAVAVAGPQEEG